MGKQSLRPSEMRRMTENEWLRRYVDGLETALDATTVPNTLWVFDGKIHHRTAGSLLAELRAVVEGRRRDG